MSFWATGRKAQALHLGHCSKSSCVPFGPLLEKLVCSIWATARKNRVFEIGECSKSGNVEMAWVRGQSHMHVICFNLRMCYACACSHVPLNSDGHSCSQSAMLMIFSSGNLEANQCALLHSTRLPGSFLPSEVLSRSQCRWTCYRRRSGEQAAMHFATCLQALAEFNSAVLGSKPTQLPGRKARFQLPVCPHAVVSMTLHAYCHAKK